ncbi:MAG TPA: cytochrome b/b6 domain-containing protein [Zeimonas sp.]
MWDLPTRLFHWALAACVVGSIVSANVGGNAFAWHFRFGYAILALLLFRLAWGFVGPRYARFANFAPSPAAALRHLRGAGDAAAGHSPLGALSVYAMLVVLAVQAVTGLFANDAILWEGPLRNTVSNATSDRLTSLHLANRVVLIALVVLHLASIAWYSLVRRKVLVRPMIVGDAEFVAAPSSQPAPPAAADGAGVRGRALALLAACAALVWVLVTRVA